jgi:hypothetical protein
MNTKDVYEGDDDDDLLQEILDMEREQKAAEGKFLADFQKLKQIGQENRSKLKKLLDKIRRKR